MIQLKNLGKEYVTKKKVRTNALQDVNLTFEDKGMTFVIGKTGCGKSTLLNLLGKLDEPTSGEIIVNNDNITQYDSKQSDNYRNNYVGFVFQEYNLIDEFTVYENISMVSKLKGDNVDEAEIDSLLKKFDLYKEKHKRCDELSGGQRQRVAIIRAIVKKPKLILADEPTGALDSKTGTEIFKILKELSKQTLVVVVTHDLEYAEQFADRIIEIKDGQVAKDTKPKVKFVPNKNHIGNNQKQGSFKFKDLFRLGMSNLGSRWKRLVLMLLVSVLAFSILGAFFSYYTFDKEKILIDTIYNSGQQQIYLENNLGYFVNPITQVDIDNLSNEYNRNFYPTYNGIGFEYGSYRSKIIKEDKSLFYPSGYTVLNQYSAMEINQQIAQNLNVKLLCGNYPTNDNEIVVNEYFYIDMLDHDFYGYQDGVLSEYIVDKPEDLIGKQIETKSNSEHSAIFTIVGVLDTDFDMEQFSILKQVGLFEGGIKENEKYRTLQSRMAGHISTTLNRVFFINEGYLDRNIFSNKISNYLEDINFYVYTSQSIESHQYNNPVISDSIASLDYSQEEYDIIWKDSVQKESLADNEIVICYENYEQTYSYASELVYDGKTLKKLIDTKIENLKANDDSLTSNQAFKLAVEQVFNEYVYQNTGELYLDIDETETALGVRYEKTLKIVGVALRKSTYTKQRVKTFVSQGLLDDIKDKLHIGTYNGLFVGTKTKSEDKTLLKTCEEYNSLISFQGIYFSSMRRVEGSLSIVAKYTLLGGCVLAIFAGLLFYSYMSVIIDDKKKQTGILRSLGASKKDIAILFFIESVFLSIIIFVLANSFAAIISLVFNNVLINEFDFMFKILSFGLPSMVVILLVTLLISALSTAIPVIKLSKLKPIEAIKDK